MTTSELNLVRAWLVECVESVIYHCGNDQARSLWFARENAAFKKRMADTQVLWVPIDKEQA